MAEPVLAMAGVIKTYRSRGRAVTALSDFSLVVPAGEFVAVQGPSGSGKTTALLAAAGLLTVDTGDITVDGTAVVPLSPAARARLRATTMGFAFQQFHLLPYLSVLDNVLVAPMAAGIRDAGDRARALLVRLGLEHRMHHVPGELSAGEQQRTALARALVNDPKMILADEPTGNLDVDNARVALDHLVEFAREGRAVVLVTHDDRVAERADRTVRLEGGRAAHAS
jgi:ABC-type lipoprotein export system ATPase subunit